jgi:hypothetical protein
MVDYELKYRDLADRVIQLLDKQKQYFQSRDKGTLKECKALENSMRKECNGIVYAKTTAKTSKSLFEENGLTIKDFL